MCRTNNGNLQNKKAPFHLEKLRSFAFKTLMHSFRTSFHEIVPEYAQNGLSAEHFELLQFLKKVYLCLPKIKTTRTTGSGSSSSGQKTSAAAKDDLGELAAEETTVDDSDTMTRKAKLFDLFGFYSFNKDFRKRVFSDQLFSVPLLMLMDHYTHFRSKFKDYFVEIFKEFKEECFKENFEFHSASEMLKIEREFTGSLEPEKRDMEKVTKEIQAELLVRPNMGLAFTKLSHFTDEYKIDSDTFMKIVCHLLEGDLFTVFMTLVKTIEDPVTVPTLQSCFELYLELLKIKHTRPRSQQGAVFTTSLVGTNPQTSSAKHPVGNFNLNAFASGAAQNNQFGASLSSDPNAFSYNPCLNDQLYVPNTYGFEEFEDLTKDSSTLTAFSQNQKMMEFTPEMESFSAFNGADGFPGFQGHPTAGFNQMYHPLSMARQNMQGQQNFPMMRMQMNPYRP
mmetsp:Transcript_5892/g.6572  ORF Transcript_5892/g.6572 Transcript_5892/m.6572 type:complete len:450 (-) Transcript_5892:1205-2554(-)|eukprot:CAMPEP_0115013158 /NCGR_PEP_ID=MMETSP0216-20121206/25223_1 /TAXON_ID=223996 /ORGANISM="Protocruzia adherens, Strain Boccale" /LENGTH=449 /DNA_ID=CAMNT_0002382467 /DNA_START=69 /DNA_END=1418 /DNA_ORIENTATION=+